jgi:hypothetical protein
MIQTTDSLAMFKRALALACTSALDLALGADAAACDVVIVP